MSRCESDRIASILPTCALPIPIMFAMCASQHHYFEISTRFVRRSAIIFSPPSFESYRVHLIFDTCTTAHVFTFAATLHFLVYFSAFSICFCNPNWYVQVRELKFYFVPSRRRIYKKKSHSGVCDTPTKSCANIKIPTPYLLPSWLPALLLRSLLSCY